MRVLHLYRTYFPDTCGGLEEALRQICASTTRLGVENRIFTLSPDADPAEIDFPEARVVRQPRSGELASCGFSLQALTRFRRHAQWADIIHYQFPWPFADVLDFLAPAHIPRVVTYQSDIVRQRFLLGLYTPLMRRFLTRAERIVATSPAYARTSPVLSRYSDKLEVIPNALDMASYPHSEEKHQQGVVERYGSDYFLFVGVLRYYKGLHTLIEAACDFAGTIVIAGTGPEEEKLKHQVRVLGLNNVYFAGYVSPEEKVALYQHALAVVFPSHLRSEAFGMTLVEGAMYARPLISCEIGTGTSYINAHGKTGIVIPPQNVQALRNAMEQLYRNRPLAREYGTGARRRYEQEFSATQMGQAYHELYRDLLRE